jgi:aminomethyltransferase
VGLVLGGHPIVDYAPDFWIIRDTDENPIGFVTSPWYSPELETNIAMGFVPVSSAAIGTELKVSLPDLYSITPGESVPAEVVEMPFRPSVNPNQRELLKAKGLDAAV